MEAARARLEEANRLRGDAIAEIGSLLIARLPAFLEAKDVDAIDKEFEEFVRLGSEDCLINAVTVHAEKIDCVDVLQVTIQSHHQNFPESDVEAYFGEFYSIECTNDDSYTNGEYGYEYQLTRKPGEPDV